MVHEEATKIAREIAHYLEESGSSVAGGSIALVRLLKELHQLSESGSVPFSVWVAQIEEMTSFGGKKPEKPIASA